MTVISTDSTYKKSAPGNLKGSLDDIRAAIHLLVMTVFSMRFNGEKKLPHIGRPKTS